MPRIRTLKPEHRQHRKVGRLSHLDYRLWVGMICEADDEGRLVAAADQLRVLIFGYWPEVDLAAIELGLASLAKARLVRLYTVGSTRFADFPSWKDHQRINRPTPSKLPPYKDSRRLKTHGVLRESSLSPHAGSEGSGEERKGSEGKGGERGGEPVDGSRLAVASAAPWALSAPGGRASNGNARHEALIQATMVRENWTRSEAEAYLAQS